MNQLHAEIEVARIFASKAHAGQLRRGGKPYFTHVRNVALSVSGIATPAAYLHDIIENTEYNATDLRKLFSPQTVDAVVILTKKEDEDYETYLKYVKGNAIAREVKIADMTDNLNDDPTPEAAAKYRYGIELLNGV